jgi:hypothetical protein
MDCFLKRENIAHVVIIVVVMCILYRYGALDCILIHFENGYSWLDYLINQEQEKYSVCPPSDCTKYRVRKDQLYVINPFKWPWSASDQPQYAVSYDEVNQVAKNKVLY